MEPYKKYISEESDVFHHIFKNAFGNPIIFTDTPTNATMKANSWGKYSTDVYIKFADNVTLKLTGSAVS